MANMKLAPQNCFLNFFTRNVQTKIWNAHTCANDEQPNEL